MDISAIKLDFSQQIDCKNSQILEEILHQFDRNKDDLNHKENIDKLVNLYQIDETRIEKATSRRIVINCFTRFNSKKHTRKYLCEKLRKSNLFETIVRETVNDIKTDIAHNNFPMLVTSDFMNFIYVHLQNSTYVQFDFIITELFPFYSLILDILIRELKNYQENCEDILNLIHYILQHQLIVLSKSDSWKLKDFSIAFLRLNHQLLSDTTIKFDIKTKCGLILGYWLNNLPEIEKINVKHRNFPILDFFDNLEDSKESLKLKDFDLINVFIDDKMKIIFYITLYNIVDVGILKSSNLLVEIYRKLLYYGIKFTSHPEQIILITRNLCQLFAEFEEEFDGIFDETLRFIWSHLEHFIESVCHNIRQLFRNFIKMASYNQDYLTKLLEIIKTMSIFSTVRLTALGIFAELRSDFLLKSDRSLQRYLLNVITDENMSVKAGEIYIKLLLEAVNHSDFVEIWLRPIQQISKNTQINEQSIIYQNIITEAFKMKPAIFQILFKMNQISNSVENGAFLKCVQYARTNNLTFFFNDEDLIWRCLVPKDNLTLFMFDQNDEIRVLVLETIVETQKTTEEILQWEFKYLYEYYYYNASIQIPNIRKKIGNLYKKFLNRYQLSYGIILKNWQQNREVSKNKLDIYDCFLKNLTKLAISYLNLDSNHPRRSLALELLIILQKMAKGIWISLFSIRDIENLKRIIFDSYESNRIMAVTLLNTLPPELLGFTSEDTSLDYFQKCQKFVRDIRPSISLSASYMFQICLQTNYPQKIQQLSNKSTYRNFHYDLLTILSEQLEELYKSTKGDLLKASQISPLYGLLTTIKNLLLQPLNDDIDLYSQLFQQLLKQCLVIKDDIMPVVSNQSPEGNLGDINDIDAIDETSVAQKILVYSWRTIKEIMLLFNEFVKQTILHKNQLLDENDLILIGEFFIDIFIQTKHRGVFEQAYIAFSSICYNYYRSNMRNLPIKWLKLGISLCSGELIDDRLCSTRRSAGLPFLILSVLTTEPNFTNFSTTMDSLLKIAEIDDDNIEKRMHSLNVLRFIFINSKIGDLVTPWIDRAMIASLKGFENTNWGIRNSSTLLFSALITRIFGVQRSNNLENLSPKNRLTISTFNLRYPNLLKFLLKILIEESSNRESQILYPILLILARLYPSNSDKTYDYIQEFQQQIRQCLSNPECRTRKLSAMALIVLNCRDFEIFQQDFNVLENKNHGFLLQIYYFIKLGNQITPQFSVGFITNFSKNLQKFLRKSSDTILSLTMEITTLLLLRITERTEELLVALKNIVGILAKNRQISKISTSLTKIQWNRSLLILCILIKQFELTSITPTILTKEIMNCLYSNDNQLKSSCLLFLIYLNQSLRNSNNHPLLYYEILEIPPTTKSFVDSCSIDDKLLVINSTMIVIKYFLYNELKYSTNLDPTTVLLMQFYPKILQQIYSGNPRKFVDFMLDHCSETNEELTSAILTTITNFILSLNELDWKLLDWCRFIGILMKFSSPIFAEFSRLTIAQILNDLTTIYYYKQILSDSALFNVANTVMILLEDEELSIRNCMARIAMEYSYRKNWYCIPCKAREGIIVEFCSLLSVETRIRFLVLWAIRQRNPHTNDISEIYERGELNQYAENHELVRYCCRLLNEEFRNLQPVNLRVLTITRAVFSVINEQNNGELIPIFIKIIDFLLDQQDCAVFQANFRQFLYNLLDEIRQFVSIESFLLNFYTPFL